MRIALIVILVSIFQTCFSQVESSNIDWKTDIEFLKKELPVKHKDFFTIKTKDEFEQELNKIITKLEYLDDNEVIFSLQQVLASFGDSHTHVPFSKLMNPKKSLPFTFYWFTNGLYILETSSKNQSILGDKVLGINNHLISQVCDSLKTMFTVDNKAIVKLFVPELIKNRDLLKYFGFVEDENFEFEVERPNGVKAFYTLDTTCINLDNRVTVNHDSLAYCWRNKDKFFNEKYFLEDSIYYVQYNRCSGRELMIKRGYEERAAEYPSFKEFEEKIFSTIKSNPIKKFVFDMRFNGGGSSLQGTSFIKKLSEFEKINKKGVLYVVTGRNTFSSAILNTMDYKSLTEAIIIGEETSGKPNHFGETTSFILPQSKMHIIFSTKYFKNTDEDINTIVPDINIKTSFENYIDGIDPVYEWIKNN